MHIADLGARSLLDVARLRPKPGQVSGLLDAHLATAAPLRTSALPRASLGRLALVALWDDDAAIDAFEADHPVATAMSGGWRVRLEPVRRWGSWPGLPESLPTERAPGVDLPGPFAVVTLARTRMTRIVRFLQTAQKAESAAVAAPGFIWGTALAMPPFFATVSLWESTRALSTYAYGRSEPAHHDAIESDEAKPFHHQSAFIRFRPYASIGSLGGKNALPAQFAEGT
ncbi:MAG: spheroidene monooxygenase [Actinobacteria bacterium]|nr:spheroidene monooxygenase [Actinomycetota bacterium]